jgi:hypothetical protein
LQHRLLFSPSFLSVDLTAGLFTESQVVAGLRPPRPEDQGPSVLPGLRTKGPQSLGRGWAEGGEESKVWPLKIKLIPNALSLLCLILKGFIIINGVSRFHLKGSPFLSGWNRLDSSTGMLSLYGNIRLRKLYSMRENPITSRATRVFNGGLSLSFKTFILSQKVSGQCQSIHNPSKPFQG